MNSTATAIVTALVVICSSIALQANIINPQLGGYLYGSSGGYGPQTCNQKVGAIGCGGSSVLQGPAATASITRSAAAVSVPVPVRCRYRLVNRISPFHSGYAPVGLVEGAAIKKNELLDRLLLKRSQKLFDCRAAELQRSPAVRLLRPQLMFVSPACYN